MVILNTFGGCFYKITAINLLFHFNRQLEMEVKDGEMLSSLLSPRQRSARDCLVGWWCAHIALSLRLPINLWTIQLIVLSKNAQMTMLLWTTALVLLHLPAKRWCITHQIIHVSRPQPTHMNQLLILTLVFSNLSLLNLLYYLVVTYLPLFLCKQTVYYQMSHDRCITC